MRWEFFKYAEIGGTRAVVSRMIECPRCGGVHTTLECEFETSGEHGLSAFMFRRPVRENSSVGEGAAFPWEANSFPCMAEGAR